jgi:hypothetical protein
MRKVQPRTEYDLEEGEEDKGRDSPTPSHLNPGRILNRLGALGPLYLGRLGPLFFLLLYTCQLSIVSLWGRYDCEDIVREV